MVVVLLLFLLLWLLLFVVVVVAVAAVIVVIFVVAVVVIAAVVFVVVAVVVAAAVVLVLLLLIITPRGKGADANEFQGPESAKMVRKWCPGSSGAAKIRSWRVPGRSRGVQRSSRGGPGAREVPGDALRSSGPRFWAPPGDHFGCHFTPICCMFSYIFYNEFLHRFLMPF